MVDILIIRNKCDPATEATNWIGKGLKTHLKSKGYTVTDLSNVQASPENVNYWLNYGDKRTKKVAICLDHGSCWAFYGEKNNVVTPVITKTNAEDLTKKLHVYTFACSTSGNNCVGQTAVEKCCYSWLGYTEPVYVILGKYEPLKECIWSYIDAMVAGKTIEQCEAILKQAYKDRFSLHWIFKYNHDRLRLRKKQSDMSIITHNRCPPVDVYIRDDLKDNGQEPSQGSLALSPDIIITLKPVPNPQQEFGDMSKNYGKNKVEIGNDNHIYLRVSNKSNTSSDVHAKVYFAPLTTSCVPSSWEFIGETILKDVPAHGYKVSGKKDVIVWKDVPDPGNIHHFCVIASIAGSGDPHPDTSGIHSGGDYWKFVKAHNNIANLNIRMVNDVPDGLSSTNFRIQGFPSKTICDLELDAKALPAGSSVGIKIRKNMFKKGKTTLKNMYERTSRTSHTNYWFYLKRKGVGIIKNLEIPPGNGYQSTIEVKLSENARNDKVYPLRISQKIGGKIIGSVTLLIHSLDIKQVQYIAVKSRHLIHKSSCPAVKNLNPENIVPYNSIEDARIDGFDWALDCLNKSFTSKDVSFRLTQKVLRFINKVEDSNTLCKKVEDTLGIGYYKGKYGKPQKKGIGLTRTTANRIIKRRKELGRFTHLQQIDEIPYVGKDTFIDIVNSFK